MEPDLDRRRDVDEPQGRPARPAAVGDRQSLVEVAQEAVAQGGSAGHWPSPRTFHPPRVAKRAMGQRRNAEGTSETNVSPFKPALPPADTVQSFTTAICSS